MKYLIPFLFILIACTPQRRFNRLIKKHPYLLTNDSIIIRDTIYDTIRIINDYSQIKEYNDTIRMDSNTFYIHDTITKNKIIGRGFEATLREKNYIYNKDY